MKIEVVTVSDLVERINLELLTRMNGLDRVIVEDSISQPSLELSGIFDYFNPQRIQIMGPQEQEMLEKLIQEKKFDILERLVQYQNIPLFIFSRSGVPHDIFLKLCEEHNIPIYHSNLTTTMLISKISQTLREYFAPQTSVHGVMLDVCGVGVLLQGASSIGKSETALELITRGKSQLIADDRVILYENEPGLLIARAPKILERLIEIRGIGIVDAVLMYGAGAFRANKRLNLVIELRDWDKKFAYNRIGIDYEYVKFLNTGVAKIIIPIHPGRNAATLIEAASINFQLRELGINTAERFKTSLTQAIDLNRNEKEDEA